MSGAPFTDDILMAYADGELDAGAARAVEQAMAEDEALAERVAIFADTRQLARLALAPALAEPVPAALQASIAAMLAQSRSAQTVPLPSDAIPAPAAGTIAERAVAGRPASNDNAPRRWLELGMAASVALVLGFSGGMLLRPAPDAPAPVEVVEAPAPAPQINMAALAEPQIVRLLGTLPSGQEQRLDNGGRFKVIATFRDEAGGICREFEIDATDGKALVSVACRANAMWDLRFSVAAAQNELGYAPASSLETLDAFYSAIGAQAPLSPEDEKAALATLP